VDVLYCVLGGFPASEFYKLTFRNAVSVPPMKMEPIQRSETSAYKIQTLGNYPEDNMLQLISSSSTHVYNLLVCCRQAVC
jgi:hypothetical protein